MTLPHTSAELVDINQEFGSVIADMVSGLTSLDQYANTIEPQSIKLAVSDEEQLEKIRRAILSIIEGDIRIILIRLADCLEDLRWAPQLPPLEQLKVAKEAMDIYAPLANRLGVWQLKWELEDLAFRYLEPERYKKIAANLSEKRGERKKKIDNAVARLRHEIKKADIKAAVYGRPKHIYSIHRKMVQKELEFEHIYDVQALRVILEPDSTLVEDKRGKSVEGD